jgi:hypothetical protein
MSSQPPFLDLLTAGKVSPEQIDDFVDRWHETSGGRELHDYLGMTAEEYSLWLRVPDALRYVVAARRNKQPLAETVAHACKALRQTSLDRQDSQTARLEEWLSAKGVLI